MKTNIGLVEYAKAQLGRPYWYGTFGQKATKKLLNDKANQYPRQFSDSRKQKAIDRGDIGQKVHDCYGLYKGYLMSSGVDVPAVYDSKYDISADDAYTRATEKGTISKMPDIIGIGLYKKGHFGVYIGNGKEIEARGFDYGVVEDEVANTKFTHWFKLPEIEYVEDKVEEPVGNEQGTASDNGDESNIYTVVKGDTLTKIASKFGVTVADLVGWNGIKNPDLIVVGQKLIVKGVPVPKEPDFRVGIVNTNSLPLNVRKGAGLQFAVIGSLPKGSEVNIAYSTGEWGKLFGRDGYVSMKFIKWKYL